MIAVKWEEEHTDRLWEEGRKGGFVGTGSSSRAWGSRIFNISTDNRIPESVIRFKKALERTPYSPLRADPQEPVFLSLELLLASTNFLESWEDCNSVENILQRAPTVEGIDGRANSGKTLENPQKTSLRWKQRLFQLCLSVKANPVETKKISVSIMTK